MAQYLKTEDNRIYKFREKHNDYLLCTPWNQGEDRRKQLNDLVNPSKLRKDKALFEINEAWRNTNFKWNYNGKRFETRGAFNDAPTHSFHHAHRWTDRQGKEHLTEYDDKYKLVLYQGKLVWVALSQYYPQIYYYPFEDIDEEPKGCQMGWTNIRCVQPIFCVTDKKFI